MNIGIKTVLHSASRLPKNLPYASSKVALRLPLALSRSTLRAIATACFLGFPAYLQSLQKFIKEARNDLPEDEQLCNLMDAIADLVDSTTYKLRFLK